MPQRMLYIPAQANTIEWNLFLGIKKVYHRTFNQQSQRSIMEHAMTTTAFALEGYRTLRTLGVVRGITVRSRSIFGSTLGALQTIVGGNISAFTQLCEKTREEAFETMLAHAWELGANAVVGIRYDATEIMGGVTEVLCYGTAVIVEALSVASEPD